MECQGQAGPRRHDAGGRYKPGSGGLRSWAPAMGPGKGSGTERQEDLYSAFHFCNTEIEKQIDPWIGGCMVDGWIDRQ